MILLKPEVAQSLPKWRLFGVFWPEAKTLRTIIFLKGNGQFPMPNLVLKTIKMVKKVYGLEICVLMAPSRGATSGSFLSAVFSLF